MGVVVAPAASRVGGMLIILLDNYEELDPIILSVGEEDEVSIGDVAQMVADAMDFKGKLVVSIIYVVW